LPIGSNEYNELQSTLLLGRPKLQLKDCSTAVSGLGKWHRGPFFNFNIEAIAAAVAQPRDFSSMKCGK